MHAAELAAGVGERVEELAIESFYPADETTAAALRTRPAP